MSIEPPRRHRLAIPVTCTLHGGTPGFTNLVMRRLNGEIELDPHVTGACVILLPEDSARAVHEALGEWLG